MCSHLVWLPCEQAVFDDWECPDSEPDDIKELRKSYDGLPSNAHRRMFKDAALLLHGQPVKQLTDRWESQLQLDDSGDRKVFRGAGRRRGGQRTSIRAARLLQDLVDSSLVQLVTAHSDDLRRLEAESEENRR